MEEDIKKQIEETLGKEMDHISDSMKKNAESDELTNVRTQIFVVNTLNFSKDNSGIIFGDRASLENVSFGGNPKEDTIRESGVVSKECVVINKEKLSDWLAEHYNDYEMAFLIALAVFEGSPYLWVYDIAEDLFDMMEGDKQKAYQQRIRIPNRKRIETAGGRRYKNYIYNHTGRVEEEFICFQKPEYAPRVLECVWNEFIFFRDQMIKWLEKYISGINYSKTIKAMNALAQLLKHDFYYFEKAAIKPLLERDDFIADFAIAQIMAQAHENVQYRSNVEHLYLYWAKQGKLQYSFIALMMCAVKGWPQDQVRPAIEGYIDRVMQDIEKVQKNEYQRQLPLFYAVGKRRSVYFKMIVEVLYDKMQQYDSRKGRDKQKAVGEIFWELINIDDMESHIDVNRKESHKDMIFVKMCLMKNEIAPKLQEMWKYLWKSRDMRTQTKKFLERYLYQYGGCGQEHIDYLRQFLYSFQDTQADMEDMDFFLKKISLQNNRPVRLAEKVNQRRISNDEYK
ncbi:MAG: hypothetical protein J6J79_00035 [Lachnospiraceae bacterium]|nr:hypothetical protein [Lachnospiraceae bacterium]